MPDWTRDTPKFNPQGPGNPTTDPNHTGSDWTGYLMAGGPLGVISWKSIVDILADAGSPIAAPSPLNHVTAEGRFTDADAAGKYILGHGVKTASGAAAASPMQVFPATSSYMAGFPDQLWILGAIFAVNSVPIPDSVHIDVGFYPVTVGGGADALTYTLSGSGAIIEAYSSGLPSGLGGVPNSDRRADFAAAGDQNYGLGVELHSPLPADCVLDVSMALQLSPF